MEIAKDSGDLSGRIIAAARSQLGVQFRHQGRLPGQYLDCAGLAAFVAQRIGVEYHEWPGYGRVPNNGLLESVMDSQPCLERVYDCLPGDILLMRFGREPQHLAFYTGQDTIVHCNSMVERVCEHRMDERWKKRIVRIYRFKELNESPAVSEVEL